MKRCLVIVLAIIIAVPCFAQQEKKPTITVLPSNHWCSSRFFTKKFDNQGKVTVINDYEAAFREDNELPAAVAKVGELLTGYGYSLKDYVQEQRAINDRHAEDELTMSRSGSTLVESPLDILRRVAKFDVEISIDWDVVGSGSKQSVSFIVEAFDTYTSKRIATATGISKASSDPVEKLIENSIVKQIPEFSKQLDNYFKDLQERGREIRLTLRVWDSSEFDLESEFNDEELLDCIQGWMSQNTVNGAFNLSDASESRAYFEQVRIPFFDEKGRAMDARSFGTNLRKYLGKEPYSIPAKVMQRGLGEVIIVIGEK